MSVIKRIILGLTVIIIFFTTAVFGLDSANENDQSGSAAGQNFTLYKFPKKATAQATSGPFFEVSPLDPKIIWVNYRDLAYQFDTDTKTWSSLEAILGSFAHNINNITQILKDPYDPRLIWIDDNEGVLVYNKVTKQSNILNPAMSKEEKETISGRFADIAFTQDFVWLGAFNGLYCYQRSNSRISQITAFKNSEVEYIDVDDQGRIWVNNEFRYDPQTQKVFQVYEVPGWPIKKVSSLILVNGYKFFKSPVVVLNPADKIVETADGSFQLGIKGADVYLLFSDNSILGKFDYSQEKFLKDPDGMEVFSDDELYYYYYASEEYIIDDFIYFMGNNDLNRIDQNTQEKTVFKLHNGLKFIANDDDLWLLTDDGIIHLNLADCENDFVALPETKVEDETISEMRDAIEWESDIVIRIQKFAQLLDYLNEYPDSGSDSYPDSRLPYELPDDLKEIKAIQQFLTKKITTTEKELAYYFLTRTPIQLEMPELAYKYYNALKTEFPHSKLLKYLSAELAKSLKDNCRLTEIKKMPKSREEEKLWLLGLFFMENAPYSETFPNFSYANKYFKELLRKYPKSKWADDAAYYLTTDNDFHDMGDYSDPSCVKNLQEFIKKYPKSILVPEAKLGIASHYYLYADESGGFSDPKIFTYLNTAKQLCAEVIKAKKNTETGKEATATLKRIDQILQSHPWSLEMKPNANSYRVGDPVIINFKLKNISNKDKKITMNKNFPNFGVWISKENSGSERDEVMTLKIFPGQIQKITKNIPANGGEYIEQVTLQKVTATSKGGFVRYIINEPGTYIITGFCYPSVGEPPNTEEIKIVIGK